MSQTNKIKIKVDTAKQHKNDDNPLDVSAVKMGDAVVVSRESAGSDCPKGMKEGVVNIHVANDKENEFYDGKDNINQIEISGGIREPWGNLI